MAFYEIPKAFCEEVELELHWLDLPHEFWPDRLRRIVFTRRKQSSARGTANVDLPTFAHSPDDWAPVAEVYPIAPQDVLLAWNEPLTDDFVEMSKNIDKLQPVAAEIVPSSPALEVHDNSPPLPKADACTPIVSQEFSEPDYFEINARASRNS